MTLRFVDRRHALPPRTEPLRSDDPPSRLLRKGAFHRRPSHVGETRRSETRNRCVSTIRGADHGTTGRGRYDTEFG